jgi:hypothetical protein
VGGEGVVPLRIDYVVEPIADLEGECELYTNETCKLRTPGPETRVVEHADFFALRGHGEQWFPFSLFLTFELFPDDEVVAVDFEVAEVSLAADVVAFAITLVSVATTGEQAELLWCVADTRGRMLCSRPIDRGELEFDYPGDGTIVQRGEAGETRLCLDLDGA